MTTDPTPVRGTIPRDPMLHMQAALAALTVIAAGLGATELVDPRIVALIVLVTGALNAGFAIISKAVAPGTVAAARVDGQTIAGPAAPQPNGTRVTLVSGPPASLD